MSFARSFTPVLFRPRWSPSTARLSRHFSDNTLRFASSTSRPLHGACGPSSRNSSLWKTVGLAGCVGTATLTIQAWSKPAIQCDGPPPTSVPPPSPPPSKSIINVYELSFGTVAGICTGVFVKKGLKTVAFFLGGFFVLIQAFNSMRVFHINLSSLSVPFERLFYSADETGQRRAPTVGTFWNWLVNFLTTDFQPRASFMAGLVLGLRIG